MNFFINLRSEYFPFLKSALLLKTRSSRHLVNIFVSMAVSALSNVLIMRLVATRLGPDPFGEFMLVKRNSGWVQGLVFLGLGVSLPRFLAIEKEKDDPSAMATISFGLVSLVLLISSMPLLVSFSDAGRGAAAAFLFGSESRSALVVPFVAYNLSLVLGLVIATYLQGLSSMTHFSIFNTVNMALLPLLSVFALQTDSVVTLCYIVALSTSVLPALYIFFWLFRHLADVRWREMAALSSPALWYGCTRIPGDLALSGLLAAPCLVAAHVTSVKWSGALSFGLSLLQIGGTFFSPLSVLFLPKISGLFARGANAQIRDLTRRSLLLTAVISVFLMLAAGAGIEPIIKLGLGGDFLFGKAAMWAVLAAMVPYSIYVVARSVLDALATRAYNTENALYGLAFFCVAGLGGVFAVGTASQARTSVVVGIAFSAAMAIICVLSLWRLRQLTHVRH